MSNTLSMYLIRALTMVLLLAPGVLSADHWQGRFDFRGSTMAVRLELTPGAGEVEPRAWLDLPGLLMAWEPLPVTRVEGGLQLEFPFGIGAFTIDPQAAVIDVQRLLGEEPMQLHLEPAPAPVFTRNEFAFAAAGAELAGELVLPAGKGPHPAVVLLHGSGVNTRDDWSYRSWADWLVRQGLAVLYYDKRGHGQSGGDHPANLEQLAADGVAAVRALRARADIASDRIGLMGGSQGAWLALLAAAELGDTAFLLLTSAPAVPPWRQQLQQVEHGMRDDGVAEADIEDALTYLGLYFYVARTGEAWPALQAAVLRAEKAPWGQYVDQPRSLDDLAWWHANHAVQPAVSAARLELPVLALYGGADWITPPVENAGRLPGLFPQPQRVTVQVFAGADHRLELPMGEDAQGQWQWPRMADGLFTTTGTWLRENSLVP